MSGLDNNKRGNGEEVHGWIFIGFSINVLLLGVLSAQVYIYHTRYKKDKPWIKTFVVALFFTEIVNTVFGFIYLYRSFITFFGDFERINTADWLFATSPAMTGIIACAVQLFFAWRVLVLTETWAYATIIGLVAIASGVGSIFTAHAIGKQPKFDKFQDIKPTIILWLITEVLADLMITSVLVWHLKSGLQRLDMIVDKIIQVTVQTGLITMIVASLHLILFLTQSNGINFMFHLPLCKLYSNSLMSSLNLRDVRRGKHESILDWPSKIVSTLQFAPDAQDAASDDGEHC